MIRNVNEGVWNFRVIKNHNLKNKLVLQCFCLNHLIFFKSMVLALQLSLFHGIEKK